MASTKYDVVAIDGDDLFIIAQDPYKNIYMASKDKILSTMETYHALTAEEVNSIQFYGFSRDIYSYHVFNFSSGEVILDTQPRPSPTLDEDYFPVCMWGATIPKRVGICAMGEFYYGSYQRTVSRLQKAFSYSLKSGDYSIFKISDGFMI
jgi:hypothetical protein